MLVLRQDVRYEKILTPECSEKGHIISLFSPLALSRSLSLSRLNVGMSKRLRALSAGSQPEGRRSEINKEESVPGKPLLLRLVSYSYNSDIAFNK